jgi:pyruvate/2-oxoglutarate dehydrogenase complex dihydrolipoamide acyltransferase (E2) component
MRKLTLLLIPLIAAAACNPRPVFLQPRPQREWPATLQAAKVAAREGRYADADTLLARFAADNAASYEAREALYWRALLLVDPANRQGSPADALRAINQYFANGSTAEAYDEATVLRRVVQHTDSLTRALAQARRLIAEAQEAAAEPAPAEPATPAAQPAQPSRQTTRENRNLVEEVRRLRDELSKARSELERVRRRLSEQRP